MTEEVGTQAGICLWALAHSISTFWNVCSYLSIFLEDSPPPGVPASSVKPSMIIRRLTHYDPSWVRVHMGIIWK